MLTDQLCGADFHCVFHDGQMEQEAWLFVIDFAAYHALISVLLIRWGTVGA